MKTARMAGKSKGVQDQAVADIQMAKSKAVAKPKSSSPFKNGGKVKKVMHEWKSGELHSGSKKGPVVKSQKQAIAIALSEARKVKK